jgi:hypothetical protein
VSLAVERDLQAARRWRPVPDLQAHARREDRRRASCAARTRLDDLAAASMYVARATVLSQPGQSRRPTVERDFEIEALATNRRFCVEIDDAQALAASGYRDEIKLTNEQWLQLLAITSVHEITEDGAYVTVNPALAPDELKAVQELARTAYCDRAEGESERAVERQWE